MLVKDTEALERIQKRATKFILGNSDGDYKERLVKLKLLPLMYSFELADIMFFVNSFKNKTNRFCITDFVSISCSNTRSSDKLTLRHTRSSHNQHRHFYFNRLPRLWNCLPAIDMSLSSQCIKTLIKRFLWSHFVTHFDPYNICSFHFLCPCSKCSDNGSNKPPVNAVSSSSQWSLVFVCESLVLYNLSHTGQSD